MAAVLGGVLSIARPCFAGDATTNDAIAEAKTLYAQGSKAYDEHRYKDAIDFFLEADARVGGNAALAYNTALAYDAMSDHASALGWAREYLRRAPQAADRDAVEQMIHGLEARLEAKGIQQLTVLSDPPGALVEIDGKRLGIAPWTGELRPGPHTLSLKLEGRATADRTFELPASSALELRVSLEGEPTATRSGRSRALTIGGAISLGSSAAAFGTAIGLEVARSAEEDEAKRAHLQVDSAQHLRTMRDLQLGARVTAGIGGALVTAGATMLIVGLVSDGDASEPPIAAGCGPDGCGLAIGGVF